ncbi:MAG: hypothetical protein K0R36_476 [Chryseobacterium sp.]|jgi:NAD(P)-dependent dehydrogenase (short-subunit alcohol dehydrogenase family)|nr:hypothetical protein [Chryseobacterium sp.]
MKNLQLKNKSVLITGADSGIGKAIAQLFARKGTKSPLERNASTEEIVLHPNGGLIVNG